MLVRFSGKLFNAITFESSVLLHVSDCCRIWHVRSCQLRAGSASIVFSGLTLFMSSLTE